MASSKLYEKAQDAQAQASTLDIVLITDQAFYDALEAQALVKVAQQTVDTRKTTDQQITELTNNKLRSTIDLAFADEDLARAQLLLLDAQTQYNNAINALTAVLGFDRPMTYTVEETEGTVSTPPPDQDQLVAMALKQRPDLMALDYDQQAAKKYARAQWEQLMPTLDTMAVVGELRFETTSISPATGSARSGSILKYRFSVDFAIPRRRMRRRIGRRRPRKICAICGTGWYGMFAIPGCRQILRTRKLLLHKNC